MLALFTIDLWSSKKTGLYLAWPQPCLASYHHHPCYILPPFNSLQFSRISLEGKYIFAAWVSYWLLFSMPLLPQIIQDIVSADGVELGSSGAEDVKLGGSSRPRMLLRMARAAVRCVPSYFNVLSLQFCIQDCLGQDILCPQNALATNHFFLLGGGVYVEFPAKKGQCTLWTHEGHFGFCFYCGEPVCFLWYDYLAARYAVLAMWWVLGRNKM